ncbi:histidine phosphatase family protein [Dictyobacter kobayashii]|uniref:Phosphatase n=1 Tax=Dictyobacter kobayashii TaxID=2014872 RepID=A0A402AWL0_9CHLR|nr:histidine phosphatase family protein [Dictyobacter kobayashii]GCE23475.1 phosphatase [Dictyobacter kobayashii]
MSNNRTILYITRHGQTQWNAEHRMQGHADAPLTDMGVRQATWLHDALLTVDFAAIYASSSMRAYRTAEIVRGSRNQSVIASEDLKEIGLGTWEGHLTTELEQQEPDEFFAFWNAPQLYQAHNGGETFAQVRQRVLPKVEELVNLHTGQTILLVTHAVTLKTILNDFGQRPLTHFWDPPVIHPTSLSKVVIEDGVPTIELYADVSHYQVPPSSPLLEKSAHGPRP